MTEPVPTDILANPIFSRIYHNVHVIGMNQIILFLGLPRTGKSNACLDFGWVLDRNPKTWEHRFSVESNVCKTGKELMQKTDASDTVGQCFVWEEAGVSTKGAAARKWQDDKNQLMADMFQFMGFKKHIILINLPANFLLDKAPRSLAHAIVVTKRVHTESKRVRATFKWVRSNPELNRTYYVYQRYFDGKSYKRVKNILLPRAPKDIYRAYEKYQAEYKKEWFGELGTRLDKIENLGRKKFSLDSLQLFSRISGRLSDMVLPGKNSVSPGLVKKVLSEELDEKEGYDYMALRELSGILNGELAMRGYGRS